MKSFTLTYRLTCALLALLVFTGAGLPTGIHHMDMMMMEKCETMDLHQIPHQDCEIGNACTCSISEAPATTETKTQVAPSPAKAYLSAILPFKHKEYSRHTNAELFAAPPYDGSPPIFLKNSVFLN